MDDNKTKSNLIGEYLDLQEKYEKKWGSNPYYFLSGKNILFSFEKFLFRHLVKKNNNKFKIKNINTGVAFSKTILK